MYAQLILSQCFQIWTITWNAANIEKKYVSCKAKMQTYVALIYVTLFMILLKLFDAL